MRGSFRKANLSSLGRFVGGTLDGLGMRQKVLEHEAVEKWKAVVGPQVAASTSVERVRDGIFYVCCKSSMWCNELSFYKDDLVKRLNEAVGKNVVTDIRFSARGFARAKQGEQNKDEKGASWNVEAVPVEKADVDLAKQVASRVPSEELAEVIKRAVITSKQHQRGRE